jgi:hypothetical protein
MIHYRMGKKQAVSCTITHMKAGNRILEDKNGHESFETQLSTHLEVYKNKFLPHRRHTTSALRIPITWCSSPLTGPVWPGAFQKVSWHSAHEGVEVVTLTHRPPLPPGMFLVLIFTSRHQGHGTVGRKYVTEKSSNITGNRSRDLLTSSAAP